MKNLVKGLLFSFVLILFMSQGVLAQVNFTWDGGGSGDSWDTDGNWDQSGTPGATDTVIINTAVSTDLGSTSFTIAKLVISNSSASVDLNGNNLAVSGDVGDVSVDGSVSGSFSTTFSIAGDLAISSGATFPGNANLTFNGGTTQTITGTYDGFIQCSNLTISGATILDNNLSSSIAEFTINEQMIISGTARLIAGISEYNLNYGTSGGNCLNVTSTNSDPIIPETSTFKVIQNRPLTIYTTDRDLDFYNFEHAPSGGTAQLTFEGDGSGEDFYIGNNFTISDASTGIAVSGAGTVIRYVPANTTSLIYTTLRSVTINAEWPESTDPPDNVTINSTGTFTLGASRTVSGSFTKSGSGSLTFGSTAGLTIGSSGSMTVSAGTITASASGNTIDINGTLTLSAGTLDIYDLNINDDAIFQKGGGTLDLGASGDICNGIQFEVDGIGKVDMKQENLILTIGIEPPKKISGDYSIIKKWNEFLFKATGKNTKERKKEFGKVKK